MNRKCFSCKKPAKYPSSINKAWCGDVDCGMALHKLIQAKQNERKAKQQRKELREAKAKDRAIDQKYKKKKEQDTNYQHSLTQKAFNKMRRLECILWFKENGSEPECISCGKKNMDWCCGHFKTVGQTKTLAYDRKNTHLQCNRYCNKGLSGNINGNKTTRGYIQGLHDLYGTDTATDILNYLETEQHKIKRWNSDELIQLRKECNKRIRELEKILCDL